MPEKKSTSTRARKAPPRRSAKTAVAMLPSVDEIRQRAFEIFLERGGRPGDDLQDWLQAERELSQNRGD